MRKGVKATCVLATGLGLLVSGCGGGHKATRSSGGGGYAQPSTAAPGTESAGPSASAPESSPPASEAPGSASPSAAPIEVKAKDVSIGKILVDGKEMTLYLFEKDKGGKSACTGACATAWPPLVTTGKVVAGPGVNASWLTTTDRPDGSKQVSYHGWPLYHYSKDMKPGDMNGQGVNAFGGNWYVVDAVKGEKLEKK